LQSSHCSAILVLVEWLLSAASGSTTHPIKEVDVAMPDGRTVLGNCRGTPPMYPGGRQDTRELQGYTPDVPWWTTGH